MMRSEYFKIRNKLETCRNNYGINDSTVKKILELTSELQDSLTKIFMDFYKHKNIDKSISKNVRANIEKLLCNICYTPDIFAISPFYIFAAFTQQYEQIISAGSRLKSYFNLESHKNAFRQFASQEYKGLFMEIDKAISSSSSSIPNMESELGGSFPEAVLPVLTARCFQKRSELYGDELNEDEIKILESYIQYHDSTIKTSSR